MARRRVAVVDVDQTTDDAARRRAHAGWVRGRFRHPRIIDWPWPGETVTGVDVLAMVVADYRAAGLSVPVGGYVGAPYLLPDEATRHPPGGPKVASENGPTGMDIGPCTGPQAAEAPRAP